MKFLALFASLALPMSPAFALDVVASLPYLGSLTRAVGGEHVSVTVLAPPTADPHYVDGRPSFLVALRNADALVHNGLELEIGWLPPLIDNARNANIQVGRPGNINASSYGGPFLQVGQTDRRMGDVHPGGNPHLQWDPRRATNIAIGIAKRLADLDPEHAADYKGNAARFKAQMSKRLREWMPRIKRLRGQKIITFHNSFPYFAAWVGATVVATVEPVPGIPPTPRDIARVVLLARKHGVKYLFTESWYNPQTLATIADKTGAQVVQVPGDVGSGGTKDYFDLLDRLLP